MADYPAAIYSPRTMVNRAGAVYDAEKTKVIFAEDFNKDRAEIVAIETELGTDPAGAFSNVDARIADAEGRLDTDEGDISDLQTEVANKIAGWNAVSGTLTYSSADAPNYVVSTSADLTGILGVGTRIKLTHVAAVKYFIVVAITANSLTLYGGTDYTLSDSAITLPYFSGLKSPLGFPLSPIKWMVEITDITLRTQLNPTQNVWYNPGSINISIPIGLWRVHWAADIQVSDNISSCTVSGTLSTADNSESDSDFSWGVYANFLSSTGSGIATQCQREKYLFLAAKTTYYLNVCTVAAGVDSIYINGSYSKTIIRAICAYL